MCLHAADCGVFAWRVTGVRASNWSSLQRGDNTNQPAFHQEEALGLLRDCESSNLVSSSRQGPPRCASSHVMTLVCGGEGHQIHAEAIVVVLEKVPSEDS